MNKDSKVWGLIGISTKAGKVAFGTEAVEETINRKKAKLVIIASDMSKTSKENILNKCKKHGVPIAEYGNIQELSKAIGKQNKAIICIKDKNLSEEIYKIICGGEAIG